MIKPREATLEVSFLAWLIIRGRWLSGGTDWTKEESVIDRRTLVAVHTGPDCRSGLDGLFPEERVSL
jgi:hypothetical protein